MRTLLQMTSESKIYVVMVVMRIRIVTNQSPNSMFMFGHLFMTEAMDLFPFLMTLLHLR